MTRYVPGRSWSVSRLASDHVLTELSYCPHLRAVAPTTPGRPGHPHSPSACLTGIATHADQHAELTREQPQGGGGGAARNWTSASVSNPALRSGPDDVLAYSGCPSPTRTPSNRGLSPRHRPAPASDHRGSGAPTQLPPVPDAACAGGEAYLSALAWAGTAPERPTGKDRLRPVTRRAPGGEPGTGGGGAAPRSAARRRIPDGPRVTAAGPPPVPPRAAGQPNRSRPNRRPFGSVPAAGQPLPAPGGERSPPPMAGGILSEKTDECVGERRSSLSFPPDRCRDWSRHGGCVRVPAVDRLTPGWPTLTEPEGEA
jgi:hypothetical protein